MRPTYRTLLLWTALALACSLFAVCSVFSWYPLSNVLHGPNFRRALTWELLRWNLWLPLSAGLLRWHRRLRPAGYAAVALLFPAAHTGLLLALYFPFSPAGLVAFVQRRGYALIPDLLTSEVVCGLVLGWAYASAGKLKASRLEAQLAQAQLEALKMQLHPHFLFNTLNGIAALQMEDPESAQRMLVRLSDFLRLTLENSGVQQVSLEREVDFLARYLEIERARFPRKLTVEIAVEPDARHAMVPNLILQPIVENAVRHGISARTVPGTIAIHAGRSNGSLLMYVRDTGPGIRGVPRDGRGLAITRSRLDRLYGSASRLSLTNAPEGGLEVCIEIPFAGGLCGF